MYVRRDAAPGPMPQQLLAAFRAIAPAFLAGMNAWLAARASRSGVEAMLDSLTDAALLFDLDGAPLHANPAASAIDPRVTSRLRDEAQRVAWAVGAVAGRRNGAGASRTLAGTDAGAARTVRLGALAYRLRGSVIGESLLGARPAVLVTVTAATVEPLTDDVLHATYGLTAREIQVARLIAEGLSNSEIGERLGVRFFTARNHVERTLAKLGVASRHRVGPLLRNEVADSADSNRASAA